MFSFHILLMMWPLGCALINFLLQVWLESSKLIREISLHCYTCLHALNRLFIFIILSILRWNYLYYYQVGKGLSKDEKAQKLALQHWLEAVRTILTILLVYISLNEIINNTRKWYGFYLITRLIRGIGMAITSITTMIVGFSAKASSLSFTGTSYNKIKFSWTHC